MILNYPSTSAVQIAVNDNKDSVSIHSSEVPSLLNENHILAKHSMHLLTDKIDHLSYELLAYLKDAGKEEFDDELECKEEIHFDPFPTES